MNVRFIKKGAFTTQGKSKIGSVMDLSNEEANDWMQKGYCVPNEEVVSVSELSQQKVEVKNDSEKASEEGGYQSNAS